MLHRYWFFFGYIFFIVGDLKQNEIDNIVVFMDNSITNAETSGILAQAFGMPHSRSHSGAMPEAWPIAISHAGTGAS